jgi:NAD-dependent SIR2 family protein deacetylase
MFNIADPNWKPNKINAKEFVEALKDKKKIMFLTGAGISAASGIPTFRGSNGFWTQNSNTQNLKS